MIKGKLYLRHLAYLGAERAIECENRRDRPSSQMDRKSGSHSATFIKQVSMWAVKDVMVNVQIDFKSQAGSSEGGLRIYVHLLPLNSQGDQRKIRKEQVYTINVQQRSQNGIYKSNLCAMIWYVPPIENNSPKMAMQMFTSLSCRFLRENEQKGGRD